MKSIKAYLGNIGSTAKCSWNIGGSIGVSIQEGSLLFTFTKQGQSIRQEVPIAYTACNYGNQRPRLVCKCGRYSEKLYLKKEAFICRSCTGLKYRSQSLGTLSRLDQTLAREKAALNPQEGYYAREIPERPRYMHQTTYEKKKARIQDTYEKREKVLDNRLEQLVNKVRQVTEEGFWD